MIRHCSDADFEALLSVINDAAEAYRGVIPRDCWKEPYLSREYLHHELADGVAFWGYEEDGQLVGVMGIQHVQDITLIRHAYVRTALRGRGIGGKLITFLYEQTARPVLVGTWAAAQWAIRFYEKHEFKLVPTEEKNRLLNQYWKIPGRQIEMSVVLADRRWRDLK